VIDYRHVPTSEMLDQQLRAPPHASPAVDRALLERAYVLALLVLGPAGDAGSS
jgi:hypothetical protein